MRIFRLLLNNLTLDAFQSLLSITSSTIPSSSSLPNAANNDQTSNSSLLGYLLAWSLLLTLMQQSLTAQEEIRESLHQTLRDSNAIQQLMAIVYHTLQLDEKKPAVDLHKWDCRDFDLFDADFEDSDSLLLFTANIYWQVLCIIPSLFRLWYTDIKSRQMQVNLDNFTQKYLSAYLIDRELESLKDASQLGDNMSIVVNKSSALKTVNAVYRVDDSLLEICLCLPNNYPLRHCQLEGVQRVGVGEDRWRRWMLGCGMQLSSGNCTLLEALRNWRQNVDKHFEGIEDCAICYSVICLVDRTVPTKQCKTCRNKFHGACLFKWFKTSGNSTCPLCRTEYHQ